MKQPSSESQLSTGRPRRRSELITEADLHVHLRRVMADAGSLRQAAIQLGVSAPFLSDVLRGRRDIGQKLVASLGYERVVGYRPVSQGVA